MSFIRYIISLFEESEEELRQEILEAEKAKKKAETKLSQFRQKNKPFKNKKKQNEYFYWDLAIFAIIIILAAAWGITKFNSMPKEFKYGCDTINPCDDCLIAASCMMLEETENADYIHFTVDNRNNLVGDCLVNLKIKQGGEIITSQDYDLEVLNPGDLKKVAIPIDLPSGDSDIELSPSCEWQE